MRLLALDTATEACSAAVLSEDGIRQRIEVAPRRHGELLLPMIEAVLADAGVDRASLDAVAFGRGPGAFTGVRIAVAVAQALGLGLERPLVAISDLAAIAQGAWRESGLDAVLCAIDARMGEVYAGAFAVEEGLMRPRMQESVGAAADWRPPPGRWAGAGSGWSSDAGALSALPGVTLSTVEAGRLPQARDIAALAAPLLAAGDVLDPAEALPVYLRDRVARPPARD